MVEWFGQVFQMIDCFRFWYTLVSCIKVYLEISGSWNCRVMYETDAVHDYNSVPTIKFNSDYPTPCICIILHRFPLAWLVE